jgi:chitin disaccharide deacetylase
MAFSRLIVNADDFGYSESVNRAIVKGFESALLTSTSIMANMPGFDHAVGLVNQHPFLQGRLGLHLNLTEGFPLSRALPACPLFCGEGGYLVYDRDRSLFRLSRQERDAVYEELQMQLERVLAAGIRPVHLDSHHHSHTEWAIAPLVCRLARQYNIQRIRLTRNMGHIPSRAKRIYKTLFNYWFLERRSGMGNNTDYFGDIDDMNFFMNSREGKSTGDLSFEIMVHPLFDKVGQLVDYDGRDLRQALSSFTPIDL